MTKITTDAEALAVLAAVHESIEFDYGVNGAKEVRELRDYLAARLASTSPAPIGYVSPEVLEGIRLNAAAGHAWYGELWTVSDAENCIPVYTDAAPQPVVEKDNG